MKFTKENVEAVINEYFRQAEFESCGDLIAEIHNLEDTPEKVVVPKFVAEYIEETKREQLTFNQVYQHINGMPENVWLWKKDHDETFARAWLSPYDVEVEKEPLYHVATKDGKLMLFKYENVVSVTPAPVVMTIKAYGHKPFYQLTEAEIKNYDERYWPFVVPAND